MKLSEALRIAVDNHLSPVFGEGVYQLCNCVAVAVDCGEIPEETKKPLRQRIVNRLGSNFMISAVRQELGGDFDATWYVQESQNIRFMFAEFLALELEDEGLEAEWKSFMNQMLDGDSND